MVPWEEFIVMTKKQRDNGKMYIDGFISVGIERKEQMQVHGEVKEWMRNMRRNLGIPLKELK